MARKSRYLLIAGALAPILLLALAYGLLVSEAGLRLVASVVEARSGGVLEIADARGALIGPLRISTLRVNLPDRRVDITGLDLNWTPRQIMRGHLRIDSLHIASVQITQTRVDEQAPVLPESLRVPLSLALPDIRIDSVRWNDTIILRQARLALLKPAHRYQLEVFALENDWGQASGQIRLSESAPFALDGAARLRGATGQALHLTLAGDLARIHARASGDAPIQLLAEADLAPFEAPVLRRARLELRNFDPAAWHTGLPHARIDAEGEFAGTSSGEVKGRLSARNALSGSFDTGRLPIVAMQGELAGTLDELRLEPLRLDLGQGGSLQGEGGFRSGALHLDLQTRDLNPRALHGRLKSMRLAGAIDLSGDAHAQRARADLRAEPYRLALDLTRRGDTLTLTQARLSSGRAEFNASGTLDSREPYRFDVRGGLSGFDPAAFGDFPRASLNARLAANGQLAPMPSGHLEFQLERSQFQALPVHGSGRLRLSPERLDAADIRLSLGGNHLRVTGAFGRPADRLDWLLRADALGELATDMAGKLRASGQLRGSLAAPSGHFEASASGLRRGASPRLDSLRARGRLDEGLSGEASLWLEARGLHHAGIEITRLGLDMRGRRDAHQLVVSADGGDFDLRATLAGGWQRAAWSGVLRAFTLQGRHAFELLQPARLRLARTGVELGACQLNFAGARIALLETAWQPGAWRTRGTFDVLSLSRLGGLGIPVPPQLANWRGDLMLNGAWDVSLAEQLDGHVTIRRASGDLLAPSTPALPLALQALQLDLRARAGRVRAELQARGATLGSLSAWFETTLSRRAGRLGLAGGTPLAGRGEFDLRSLTWLGPTFADGLWSLDGSARAQIDVAGSLDAPRFTGTMQASALRLDWPEAGVHLERGELRARLHDDVLRLESLRLSGGDGELVVSGTARLRADAPEYAFQLDARQLRAVTRPDRLLVVSGRVALDGHPQHVRARGELRADRARILLPRADAPTRSDDVIVLGRAAPMRGAPMRIDLDLKLDLGERFLIQGRGLDARLAGALRVHAPPGGYPRLMGGVRVVQGAYSAYGQRLEIERGLLDFQGPVDNPGLDLLAMRKNQPVEAGVAITGTAMAPRARLVSRPEVPDSDKLAWLLLGRGMDSVTGGEFDLLASAAGALLSAGDSVSLQARIADATGLDEIALQGSGELEGTVLRLGKRLSSRAYLQYEQGITGLGTLVKLQYALTPHWRLQAQTGGESAIDLFYTLSFD